MAKRAFYAGESVRGAHYDVWECDPPLSFKPAINDRPVRVSEQDEEAVIAEVTRDLLPFCPAGARLIVDSDEGVQVLLSPEIIRAYEVLEVLGVEEGK